jgi:hypothetical protein
MSSWRNLRVGRIYRILRIHSPAAHFIGVCWCQPKSKRLDFSGTIPKQRSVESGVLYSDAEAFYRFVSSLNCGDHACRYPEPHKHGFACDVTCKTCKNLTKQED